MNIEQRDEYNDPVFEGENIDEGNELVYETQKKLIELKELIESTETRINVREILSEAEVISVICGVKPASLLEKETAEAMLSNEQNTFSDQDFIQLEEYLNKMEFQLSRDTLYYHELLYIYNQENAIQAMIDSDLFTEEELDLAKEDLGKFLGSYLVPGNVGKKSAYRVGVLLGYPLTDVKDFIKSESLYEKYSDIDLRSVLQQIQSGDTQNNYGINEDDWNYLLQKVPITQVVEFKGIRGGIRWKTFNIQDPDVIKTKNKYKNCLDIQKKIMSQ
jgi:hypothetical protein